MPEGGSAVASNTIALSRFARPGSGTGFKLLTRICRPLLSALVLVACFNVALAKDPDQVRIGVARTLSDSGYYIADALGYFRDEGLDVTMIPFKSAAQMIAPLGTGELDAGGGTVSAGFYNAALRGVRVKIVADQASMKPGYGYSSLMVRKDLLDEGHYKSFTDLRGMKIAVSAPGTGTASALNAVLKEGGLRYSDVNVVYLGFPEHLAAYSNKAIDASITNEPTMTEIIKDGLAIRVAGNDITYPNQQTAVVFYAENFINHRHDVAQRFMHAYLRGVRAYNDALSDGRMAGPNASEIIAILTRYTTLKDAASYQSLIPSAVNPDGKVNRAGLEEDLKFFRDQGLIQPGEISIDQVIDPSFADAAVHDLGPYVPAPTRPH
jgi:NitT/TauT family transport system substrate-binding protein